MLGELIPDEAEERLICPKSLVFTSTKKQWLTLKSET